jgi:ssDNA-binding Zn-finger/Zn-ribbon topoisomerase 1
MQLGLTGITHNPPRGTVEQLICLYLHLKQQCRDCKGASVRRAGRRRGRGNLVCAPTRHMCTHKSHLWHSPRQATELHKLLNSSLVRLKSGAHTSGCQPRWGSCALKWLLVGAAANRALVPPVCNGKPSCNLVLSRQAGAEKPQQGQTRSHSHEAAGLGTLMSRRGTRQPLPCSSPGAQLVAAAKLPCATCSCSWHVSYKKIAPLMLDSRKW